jgi:hypothetical protein
MAEKICSVSVQHQMILSHFQLNGLNHDEIWPIDGFLWKLQSQELHYCFQTGNDLWLIFRSVFFASRM